MLKDAGLDAAGIEAAIRARLKALRPPPKKRPAR
jgi:hypothetical protein